MKTPKKKTAENFIKDIRFACRRCCLVLRLRQGNIAYTLLVKVIIFYLLSSFNFTSNKLEVVLEESPQFFFSFHYLNSYTNLYVWTMHHNLLGNQGQGIEYPPMF